MTRGATDRRRRRIAREAHREREELGRALCWLARRKARPASDGLVPELHRQVLDDLMHEVLRELQRREQAGKPCRQIRARGRTWAVRYTNFQRVLLVEQRTGAVLASKYGAAP